MTDTKLEIEYPKNLNECFSELRRKLTPEQIEQLRNKSKKNRDFYCHHNLGRYVRNAFGLWSDSPLRKFFKKLGIVKADDMSGIILESFICHLRGEPLNLEFQAKIYRGSWEMFCKHKKIHDTSKTTGDHEQ